MFYDLFDLILLLIISVIMTVVFSLPKPKKEEDPTQPLTDIDYDTAVGIVNKGTKL
jgi:hypothetical protein